MKSLKSKLIIILLASIYLGQETVFAQDNKGSISGIVTDENGKPLQHVFAELESRTSKIKLYSTTGSDGKYEFTKLDSGGYRMFIMLGGELALIHYMRDYKSRSTEIKKNEHIKENFEFDFLKMKRMSYYFQGPSKSDIPNMYPKYKAIKREIIDNNQFGEISGSVYNRFGNPINLALLTLKKNGQNIANILTNENGEYHISSLPNETYNLEIQYCQKKLQLNNIKIDSFTLQNVFLNKSAVEDSIEKASQDLLSGMHITYDISEDKFNEKTGELDITLLNNIQKIDSAKVQLYRHGEVLRSSITNVTGDLNMNFVPWGNYLMEVTFKDKTYKLNNFKVEPNKVNRYNLNLAEQDEEPKNPRKHKRKSRSKNIKKTPK